MRSLSRPLPLVATLAAAALLLVGCGASHRDVYVEDYGSVVPYGDVEVDNQTDLTGSFEDMYVFDMTPAALGLWTGNLLPDVTFPGETVFVGSFEHDFYDAEAELDLGIVSFFDVLVEEGFTTTFEVF